MTEPATIEEIRANIAATRKRIVTALADDAEAVKLLDRAFPADWGDAPIAVVWMLSNAARFATDTDGFSAAVAAEWLDRLVNADGEPRERPLAGSVATMLLTLETAIRDFWQAGDDHASARVTDALAALEQARPADTVTWPTPEEESPDA